jgi:hypothetical protein
MIRDITTNESTKKQLNLHASLDSGDNTQMLLMTEDVQIEKLKKEIDFLKSKLDDKN